MDIASRYGGRLGKKSEPADEFLDVLFAVNQGMDTISRIALKTKKGKAATSLLVMLLTREGYLVRRKDPGAKTSGTFKLTQRAHLVMQKALEVEIELGLMRENRWGVESLV